MTAVIYARYSIDNQREESIASQLRQCKEFAHADKNFSNYAALKDIVDMMGITLLLPVTLQHILH